MSVDDFISYWEKCQDTDGTPAVGIYVNWEKIQPDFCRVDQYFGKRAWEKIENFYPPLWGSFDRTLLKEWLNSNRIDYQKFIQSEENKIQRYKEHGLLYPLFCAISDLSGNHGILADGSHRFIDCSYIISKNRLFNQEIEKCRLDVLCVPKLDEVLSTIDCYS